MINWIKNHKLELIIFFCALFVRLVLFSINFSHNQNQLIPTIKGDDGYYELSQNIISGNGFSFDVTPPFRPNPLRPPVWPYLIAFFAKTFGSYWAVFILEIILGSLIPVLALYVTRRLFSERIAKWTSIFLIFDPYSVLLSSIFYTETSFTFFFLIFLIFLFRYIDKNTFVDSTLAGFFLGIATLIKPTVEYFPILIPLTLLILWRRGISKIRVKQLLIFALIFCALLFPWLYRNKSTFGVWGVSAQPAFNLFVYLAPTVLAIDNHTDFKTELANFVTKSGIDEKAITLSNSSIYKEKAIEVIRAHPVALIKSIGITLVTFFTHDGILTVFGYAGITIDNIVTKPVLTLLAHPKELVSLIAHYIRTPAAAIILMRLLWIAITIFFFIGSFMIFRNKEVNEKKIIALCIVLYFALTTSINGLGVNARFRVPVETFIFSFAIYGLIPISRTILHKLKR